jgi:6-phospho-3-hexuloisomerase
MSYVKDVTGWILHGIDGVIQSIDDGDIEEMIKTIIGVRNSKILLIGSGRSGFVGRAFALRLMHLGFNVYVGGETITPALGSNDLVIAISGSGSTKTVVTQAEASKEIGATVIAITSHPDSPLAKCADKVVTVRGRSRIDGEMDYDSRQITGQYDTAPLGTMFELSVMVFLDGVIADMMKKLGENELDLRKRHVNIE